VGVGDSRDGAGFTLKSFELKGRRISGRRQDLDGDGAFELRITSVIDLAHTSGAKWREDFVSADAFSDREGHVGLVSEPPLFYADERPPCLPNSCRLAAVRMRLRAWSQVGYPCSE
jgi:hypothetical protein